MVKFIAISIAAEQHVDEVGHVLDGHHAVTVHVGPCGQLVTTQQQVNLVGRITDSDVAVTVDVSRSSTMERHNMRELAPLLMALVSF